MTTLTAAELQALAKLADNEAIARPARRRLLKLQAIYLSKDGGYKPSSYGWSLLNASAPRSKWEPPSQQGPSELRRRMSGPAGAAMFGAMALLSLPSSRR